MNASERFPWSLATKHLVEQTLLATYPEAKFDWLNDTPDDIERGVDLCMTLIRGRRISIQAKVLNQITFDTITVELDNGEGKKGDWETMVASILVTVYSADGETVEKSCIVDLPRLWTEDNRAKLRWKEACNSEGRSKFRFINLNDIDAACIISKTGDWSKSGMKMALEEAETYIELMDIAVSDIKIANRIYRAKLRELRNRVQAWKKAHPSEWGGCRPC